MLDIETEIKINDALRSASKRLPQRTIVLSHMGCGVWAMHVYCKDCGAYRRMAEITNEAFRCAVDGAVEEMLVGNAERFVCSCWMQPHAYPKAKAESLKTITDEQLGQVMDEALGLIDGLTEAECLERFQKRQHTLDSCRDSMDNDWCEQLALTDRQLETARAAWSAQLRAKVNEAKEKERCRVVVDMQEGE